MPCWILCRRGVGRGLPGGVILGCAFRTVIAVDCYYPSSLSGHFQLKKGEKKNKKTFVFAFLVSFFFGSSPPLCKRLL